MIHSIFPLHFSSFSLKKVPIIHWKNGAMSTMNFWTVSYFLYISLTLCSPIHTILPAHNFLPFSFPPSNFAVFPPVCQRHGIHILFCSTGHVQLIFPPTLFVCFWNDKEPLQFTALLHTQIFQSLTAPVLSAALPLCLSHISHRPSTVFSPPSALPFASLWCQSQSLCHKAQWEHGKARKSPAPKAWCCLNCRTHSSQGLLLFQTRPQDRGSSEDCNCAGTQQSACASQEFCGWKGFTTLRRLQTQDAAPGDAEVKRGEKNGCTLKERQRHQCKLLLPRGGSQRKSLEFCWRGNGENPDGSVSSWSQRRAGRQNSPKWAAVGAKES